MWLLPAPNMTVVWLRWGENAFYIGGVIVGMWLILTGSTWEYYSACQCAECQVMKQEQNIASEKLPLIVYFLLWSFFPCKLWFRLHVYQATSSSASSGVGSPLFVVYWHVAERERRPLTWQRSRPDQQTRSWRTTHTQAMCVVTFYSSVSTQQKL